MNFNSVLFSISTSEAIAVCEHSGELIVHPNVEIPDASMSSRRSSGASRSPKISALYYPLEHVFRNKDMAVLASKDGSVYCEMTVDSVTESYLWHGDTFYSDKSLEDKKGRSSFLMCLLLSCLIRNPSHYSETGIYLSTVTTSFEKSSYVPKKEMASLCDCLYYDLKDEKASAMGADIRCKPFDSTVQNLVQQSIRTMNMTFPAEYLDEIGASKFADHLAKVFKNVTLSERATKASDASSSTVSEPTSTFIHDCKYGQYEIGYEWTPEQMKRVRRIDFLNGFIPNETFECLVKLADYDLNAVIGRMNTGASGVEAIGDNYINTILVGKPGTGKTTTAEALSATLGMPIYTVKNSKNTEEDTFEGMTKVVDGNFAFRSTPFLEAFEHGGILILEEFNRANRSCVKSAGRCVSSEN